MSVTTSAPLIGDLDELPFDNRFTRDLPADPEDRNSRRQVFGAAFSRVRPTPVSAPTTLTVSYEVADLLGLAPEVLASNDFAQVFGGNRVPKGSDPFAMAYGGHQFGNWAGQLGDGRAITLGEVVDRHGTHQMLQLKGAGPTPYSRTADGRAVLRSSIREFLCSEAMFHLGIPTTRALSLVLTGDQVLRDVLYDGHPAYEPGAVVCRVAPSFTRFGTFQLPASRGDTTLLERLVRVTVEHDFPHLSGDAPIRELLASWLGEVVERTAVLVVGWMRVGFVHGVLNTDNLSITGETIDYGPYGWLEDWNPGWTPNTTDAVGRRYRYGQQPQVVHWNLVQLANALVPLVGDDVTVLQEAVDRYPAAYEARYRTMMADRLGWGAYRSGDDTLFESLNGSLALAEIDQVVFFRDLADLDVDPAHEPTDAELLEPLENAWYRPEQLTGDVAAKLARWLRDWRRRVADGALDDGERKRRMDAANPRYVLRNYLAQEAIDRAEDGDPGGIEELLDVTRRPYLDQPGRERFAAKRPDWARDRVGCSMLSCSS